MTSINHLWSFCLALLFILTLGYIAGCSELDEAGVPEGDGGYTADGDDIDVPETDGQEDESDENCLELIFVHPSLIEFGAVPEGTANTKEIKLSTNVNQKIFEIAIYDDKDDEFSIVTDNCAQESNGVVCHKVILNQTFSSDFPYTITVEYIPINADLPDSASLHIDTDDPCVSTKRVQLGSDCKGEFEIVVKVDEEDTTTVDFGYAQTALCFRGCPIRS